MRIGSRASSPHECRHLQSIRIRKSQGCWAGRHGAAAAECLRPDAAWLIRARAASPCHPPAPPAPSMRHATASASGRSKHLGADFAESVPGLILFRVELGSVPPGSPRKWSPGQCCHKTTHRHTQVQPHAHTCTHMHAHSQGMYVYYYRTYEKAVSAGGRG